MPPAACVRPYFVAREICMVIGDIGLDVALDLLWLDIDNLILLHHNHAHRR